MVLPAGQRYYDRAPTGRSTCLVWGKKIAKGESRLDYRMKASSNFQLPQSTRAADRTTIQREVPPPPPPRRSLQGAWPACSSQLWKSYRAAACHRARTRSIEDGGPLRRGRASQHILLAHYQGYLDCTGTPLEDALNEP